MNIGKLIVILGASMATSLLAVAIQLACLKFFDFNLFSFTVNLILPVGALLLGLVAASGFYFAAVRVNQKPDILALALLLVIAAATQALMYYGVYADFKASDTTGLTADIGYVDFVRYLLEHQRYQISNHGHNTFEEAKELGKLGYAAALLEYAGLAAGGVILYKTLQAKPACNACGKYEKPVGKKLTHTFADSGDAVRFVTTLQATPVESLPAILPPNNTVSRMKASVLCHIRLIGCADCQSDSLYIETLKKNGKAYTKVPELSDKKALPQGHSLRGVFVTSDTL